MALWRRLQLLKPYTTNCTVIGALYRSYGGNQVAEICIRVRSPSGHLARETSGHSTLLTSATAPCLQLRGGSYHTGSFKTLFPPSLSTGGELRAVARLHGLARSPLLVCASLHTQGTVAGPAERKPKQQGSGAGGSSEHGSVLSQLVANPKEPKQLTTAGKG